MTIDAGIYAAQGVRPQSVADYDQQNQTYQQNALNLARSKQQLDAYTQDQAEKASLRNYLSSAPDLASAAGHNGLMAAAPTLGPAIYKSYQDGLTSQALAHKDNSIGSENDFKTKTAKANQAITDITNLNSPQDAIASLNQHLANGDIDQQKYAGVLSTLQPALTDPTQFGQWKRQMVIGIMDAKDRIAATAPKVTMTNAGGLIVPTNENADAGPVGAVAGAKPITVTQSPDNAANNATSRANNAANVSKDLAIAGVNPDGTPIDGAGLSDQAKIAAAARYRIDGTLPAGIGRGTQGAKDTRAILDEAARQAGAAGDTPEAARITQIANKANAAALGKLQTQQTMVGAFEKNFVKNADMAEQLSNTVDRTGVPIVNSWINAGRRAITGNPDLSAFDASVKATVNEYAKIVSGATGGAGAAQGEIAKIEGLLNAAQNPQQVKAVLDLMRKETQNRMAAFEDEKSQLTGSMIKPATKPVAPAAGGKQPTVSNW